MGNFDLINVLRCPVEMRSLIWQGKDLVEPVSGRIYPESHGVIDLVAEEERYSDLGDSNHYDKFPYEFVDWSDKNSIYHAIEDALKCFLEAIPQDHLICDIGCGAGRVSAYLAATGRQNVLPIDYSRRSLEITKKNVIPPVVRANTLRLPLKSESVDVVISTGVIHHTSDPVKALSESCRVLKTGGKMYLKVYRRGSYYHFLHLFIGGFLRLARKRDSKTTNWIDGCAFHVYYWASGKLKRGRTKNKKFLRVLYEDYFYNEQTLFLSPDKLGHALNINGLTFKRFVSGRPTDLYMAHKTASTFQ